MDISIPNKALKASPAGRPVQPEREDSQSAVSTYGALTGIVCSPKGILDIGAARIFAPPVCAVAGALHEALRAVPQMLSRRVLDGHLWAFYLEALAADRECALDPSSGFDGQKAGCHQIDVVLWPLKMK